MNKKKLKKYRLQTLGVYWLIKTILPLILVIVFSIILTERYRYFQYKKQRAEFIINPVIDEYDARVDSISQSIDSIINNLTNLREELSSSAKMLNTHIGQSKEELLEMHQKAQKDLDEKIAKNTGEIKKVYIAMREDLNNIQGTLKEHLDSYKSRVTEMIGKINVFIDDLQQLKKDLVGFLEPMHKALSTIVDAIDYLLPGDISLPPIPTFPEFPELGVEKLVSDIKRDLTNIKRDAEAKINTHKKNLENLSQSIAGDVQGNLEIYTNTINSIKNSTQQLERPDFFEGQYWNSKFIKPGRNIFNQIQTLSQLTIQTYTKLQIEVFSDSLIGLENRKTLEAHRSKVKIFIYLIGFWFFILFIGYLMRFTENIKISINLMKGNDIRYSNSF